MTSAFDHIAHHYDHEFSWSQIGMLQRKIVWRFLEEKISVDYTMNVLELNCGTGEDAVWLASQNQKILATDLSKEMIKIARQKALMQKLENRIRFKVMTIQDIGRNLDDEKFDLVFSNFGGFNCLDNQQFAIWLKEELPRLLKPGGRFVTVLMSKFCAWEMLYFICRFQFRKAFRRLSNGPVEGKLSPDASINTWYHSPLWIKKNLPASFFISAVRPVGFFIPPSYLNRFFYTRKNVLAKLQKLENRIGKYGIAAFFSDHYLIEIQKKQ